MEVKLINIGNSKGIIIPAKFLKLLGLKDNARIELSANKLTIEAIKSPREDWENKIKSDLKKNGIVDRELIDVFNDENFEEWEW